MANNTYGIVKPAQFDPSKDADIFYHYQPSRSVVNNTGFQKINDVSKVLVKAKVDDINSTPILPGMYTLKLPVEIFGSVGIYTIYITPKEFKCEIKDIGVLSAYPDIKGIVIDINSVSEYRELFNNDSLIGYTIDYFDNNGDRMDYYRVITTNTKCTPVTQYLTTTTSNSNGYRYNESGTLCFLTVSPSTSPNFKTTAKPYIGVPNQTIAIKNSKFDPICVEVEIVNHDIETLSYMLEGEQVRNLENGTVSIYNFDGEMYKQMEYFTVKDNYKQTSIAEVKINKGDNIDNSIDLNSIKNM